jgi:hypothetical protein
LACIEKVRMSHPLKAERAVMVLYVVL